MTYRALMVSRMKPEHANAVADLFAGHDRGELPGIIGISRRTLFRFHDLYMHLIEADTDVLGNLLAARGRSDFQHINAELDKYLERYDPGSWRGLTDSMATP